MGSKRKFKRDYIILESKDANFRYKERVLPKAFAKVEVNDEKSVVALYVENLKYMKDGYKVVAIRSDYETIDLGKIVLSEQGKGEFILDLGEDNSDIKGIALLYERTVPLIGFKGSKIDNYEEILLMAEEDDLEEGLDEFEEYEEYEEIEYIETDEVDEIDNMDDIDSEDDLYNDIDNLDGFYEEMDYIEDTDNESIDYYDNTDGTEEVDDYNDTTDYKEIDNYEKIEEYNIKNPKQPQNDNIQPRRTNNKPKTNNKPNTAQKQTGSLLMPRQIKKGLKNFKEVKPFVCDYIEDTRWWKIEVNPTTLCGCVMPYLGYVNTLNYTMYSDAVMNSYKYRHYLFGVQYDEYNKRKNYIYAVPGSRDDQPDRGSTGFNTFQSCDNRSNSLGYWLCFIDSRYRRIVK